MKFGGRFFQTKLLSRLSHIKVCRLLPSSVLLRTSVHSAYAFDKVKIQFFYGLSDPFCCFFCFFFLFFFVVNSMIDYKWWWYYPLRKFRRGHLGIQLEVLFILICYCCCSVVVFQYQKRMIFCHDFFETLNCVQEIFCYRKWSHLNRKECS